MGRGGQRKGGSGGSRSGEHRQGGKQPSGIEKYGQDEVDEFLDLDAGDNEAAEAESDVCEEEDVMTLDAADNFEDWAPPERSSLQMKSKGVQDNKEEVNQDAGTKGWRRDEFYGGEDSGDDSGNSDDDYIFNEAKRLEELRARQLAGEEDVLASLLAAPTTDGEPESAEVEIETRPGSVPVSAQFESVFAGEAEKVSTPRNIAELSSSARRNLMKKEAPELMPLLSDFKTKLSSLRELLPLLRQHVLTKLPASGAKFLEAKAALLLNTLANLSFYILLRAEGGAVRAHPVVPQLVWLRELHEQLSPMDKKLGKKMRKALAAARQTLEAGSASGEPGLKTESVSAGSTIRVVEPPKVTRKKTLRERLERMQKSTAPTSTIKQDSREPLVAVRSQGLLTKDLLRLPKARQTVATGSASAAMDLDDVDPSLGVWAPKSSVSEQISSVQQQLNEHAVRAKAASASADQNTEARPRRATRERGERHPEKDEEEDVNKEGPPEAGDDEEDDDELIKSARFIAKLKKLKRNKDEEHRAEVKENNRRQKEYKPEEVEDGRRKTSKRILNNRGLQRIRKKHAGNARVSNKNKYEKSVKRRKGAVQEMREGAGDGATYDGESTGLRTHVQKSLKIG